MFLTMNNSIRQCSSWWSVLTRNCYNILPERAEPGEPGQCWPSPQSRRLRGGSSGISGSVTRSQSSTGALHHHHRRWIKLKKMFFRKRILNVIIVKSFVIVGLQFYTTYKYLQVYLFNIWYISMNEKDKSVLCSHLPTKKVRMKIVWSFKIGVCSLLT